MIPIPRYICIHGHFYQPPRENPWLEEIEIEDSAYPFHDWNERITAECYAPNAASRILDHEKRIIDIVNNYSKISFNFGPTLFSWLEKHNPEVYHAILKADIESQHTFSGHGSAIAQVYNHVILPLASTRDKITETSWGIQDFKYRFGRSPEGMWLSETAVDIETLEILADQGIIFTILAPHQARRIRSIGGESWTDISPDTLDTGMPYLCNLPSGQKISIFFYDSIISHEVAFEHILENGENLAYRLVNRFPDDSGNPRLLSIANDGETYGHHHRFADMALAYALHDIESKGSARITIFGEYLDKFPPTCEVAISENTSWSCTHGVKRWEDDCGCRAMYACLISDTSVCYPISLQSTVTPHDIRPWNQKWRKPLRNAMIWLNRQLEEIYEKEMEFLFHDPWQVRNSYGNLVINRSSDKIIQFFSENAKRTPTSAEITKCLKLLEMQKNALYMQTSCGWFFDDLGGIETVQVMLYACRAMQLARDVSGRDLEPEYISFLANAVSNVKEIGNGSEIYEKYVKTSIFDINRVAFQFAIMSLIKGTPDVHTLTTYDIRCTSYRQEKAGKITLGTGFAHLQSKITLKESTLMFVALHLGDHNVIGGISPYTSEESYVVINQDIWDAYSQNNLPGLILAIDRHFDYQSYSLWHLFRDGKRTVLFSILENALEDVHFEYNQLYKNFFSLITAMKEFGIPPPKSIEFPIQYTLNRELLRLLSDSEYDGARIQELITELKRGWYPIEVKELSVTAGTTIERYMNELARVPADVAFIQKINTYFTIIAPLSLTMDLRSSQNAYFRISTSTCPGMKNKLKTGDSEADQWFTSFLELGEHLGVRCN